MSPRRHGCPQIGRLEFLEPRLCLSAAVNTGIYASANASELAFKPVQSPVGTSTVLASADFNGDGRPDLVSAPLRQAYGRLLYGVGDGRFVAPPITVVLPTGPAVTAAATGDFNTDGHPDAVFANAPATAQHTVTLLTGPNLLGPPRTFEVGIEPTGLAAADFNRDGRLDLLISHADAWSPSWSEMPSVPAAGLLLGNGDGTFQPIRMIRLSGTQTHVAVGDVNGDAVRDAVFGGPLETNAQPDQVVIYTVIGSNDGTSRVTSFRAFEGRLGGLALADLNGDKRDDIVAVQAPTANTTPAANTTWPGESTAWTFLSKGDGQYTPAAAVPTVIASPAGASVADFDRDGRLDVAVTGADAVPTANPLPAGAVSILRGTGSGGLARPVLFRTFDEPPQAQLTLDANSDRWPDVVVGNVRGVTTMLNVSRAFVRRDLASDDPLAVEELVNSVM
jgi:hypothetical protein